MVFVVVVVYCTEHRVSSRYRSRRESVCVRSLCIIVYVCVCVIVDLKTQAKNFKDHACHVGTI